MTQQYVQLVNGKLWELVMKLPNQTIRNKISCITTVDTAIQNAVFTLVYLLHPEKNSNMSFRSRTNYQISNVLSAENFILS